MTDAYTAIGSAFYAYVGTAINVPLYQNLAPQGGTPPYCVYQIQTALDDYVFGGRDDSIVDADVVVRVVSNRYWPGEAMLVYGGSVHPKVQNAPLVVSGHTLLRCERMSNIGPYQDSDRYWHAGGLYRISVQGTA